jgi:hypothetical protein
MAIIFLLPIIIVKWILRQLIALYRAIAVPLHLPVPPENTMARRQSRQSSNWEGFGTGQKEPLTGNMQKTIKAHIVEANATNALEGYTYERRPSPYPTASSDIVIYNSAGKAVIQGREFAGGRMSFWSS